MKWANDIAEAWRAVREVDPKTAEVLAGRIDSLRRTLRLCPAGIAVDARATLDQWGEDLDTAAAAIEAGRARHDTQAPPSSGERRLRRPAAGPVQGLAARTARELEQGGAPWLPQKGDERR